MKKTLKRPNYAEQLLKIIQSPLKNEVLLDRLNDYHERDIADALELLSPQQRKKLYPVLGAERLAEIFSYLETPTQYLSELSINQAAKIVSFMDSDDAVDILEQMEVQQVSEQEKRAKQREEFRRQQEAEELSDAIENAQDSKGETAEAEPEMAGTDVNAEKYTSEVNEKNASEEPDILKPKSKAGNGAEEKKSVLNKLKSVQEKTGSAKEKINNGIAVFRFLREQELIPAVWTKLKTFLLHIRPRVLQGHLQFGLSDPANTGQVLGGIAMIPFLYQTELQIKPDFEADENYIKGQLYTRGHICCIHLVVLLIRLLLDKKLRGVIHMIRENK